MPLHYTGEVTNTYELIEPNTYETIISLEYKKKNDGDLYINCKFSIRDDVEQDFQKRIVFDGIYKSKTTGEFSETKINGLLAAINAKEEHPKWDFEDYEELIQFLSGKALKIDVAIQKADEKNSNDKNVVKYLSYKPTDYPGVQQVIITRHSEPVFSTKSTPVVEQVQYIQPVQQEQTEGYAIPRPQPVPAQTQVQTVPNQTAIEDDDLPF